MVDWRVKANRVRYSLSSRTDPNYTRQPSTSSHPAGIEVSAPSSTITTPLRSASASASTVTAAALSSGVSPPAAHAPRAAPDVLDPHSDLLLSYNQKSTTAPSSHVPTASVPSLDATSTGSSMSRVPGAFYIPNSIAQRASVNMPPADGAALRRQLAFDALALVRELPCFSEGWMLVKRDASKLSSLFRSPWMPFWGELRGGMLLFCDPNSDYVHDHKRVIKLVFTVTNCIIDLKNTPSYSQLKVRRADGQSLVLRVSSAQEAQQWVVSLQTHTFPYTTIRLADFDWITAIGKGASGKVFLVRDNRTNARLALKVIDKSRVFRTQLTFQHVINERLVLELCSGCPFVIQLRYAFQTDSHLYFATDFYDGGDVFSLLQTNQGRLSEHHARRIIAEIVLALCWLHERNIVYRDLKPENVVLDGDGHVRLADFGLAKVLKYEHHFLTQTICGTTAYAAPEMLQSKPYNVSLDLWCLGVFIYHILTGRTPFNFKGRTMEEMEEMQRTRTIRYSSSLSLEAVSLIKGLLHIDPFRRATLDDVKRHPFFRGVDWARVARKEPHPDDVSPFLADKEQRDTAVARLAVARAQQLGVESEAATAVGRMDLQDISSMTLDRYLLRNINAEEWRHVSFSDDDDVSATAEFPAFVHKKGAEMETWAIAGWAWTCSEASGHATKVRDGGRDGVIGLAERLGSQPGMNPNARRSLQAWNEGAGAMGMGGMNGMGGMGSGVAAHGIPMVNGRASLQEGGTNLMNYMDGGIINVDRAGRPVDGAGDGNRYDFGANMDQTGMRASADYRTTHTRRSVDVGLGNRGNMGGPGMDGMNGVGGRRGGKGMLNLGRITSSVRDARNRASLDTMRGRKSLERRSREELVRRTDTYQMSVPRPGEKRHAKSNLSGVRGRSKG